MNIPDFQTLMLPLLKFANDQHEHASREAVDYLAQLFQLSITMLAYPGFPHMRSRK